MITIEPRNKAPHERLLTQVAQPRPKATAEACRSIDAGKSASKVLSAQLSTRRDRTAQPAVSPARARSLGPLLTSQAPVRSNLHANPHANQLASVLTLRLHIGRANKHFVLCAAERNAEARRQWRAVKMAAVFVFAFAYQIVHTIAGAIQ